MMLAAAAVVLSVGVLNAQPAPLQVGIVGGGASSTLIGDDAPAAGSRVTPFFGASLVYHPWDLPVGFETGVLYAPKGAEMAGLFGSGEIHLTYIEVPLLLRLAPPPTGTDLRPMLLVGLTFGVNVGCTTITETTTLTVESDCDEASEDESFDVRSLDRGITFGLGLDVPVGSRIVMTPSARYVRGSNNIEDSAGAGDAKNSTIQLGVSVRLVL